MIKTPDIQCPRCNAVGKVTPDPAMSKFIGKAYFKVQWTRNGKPHSRDTNVKQADLDDASFGCGLD